MLIPHIVVLCSQQEPIINSKSWNKNDTRPFTRSRFTEPNRKDGFVLSDNLVKHFLFDHSVFVMKDNVVTLLQYKIRVGKCQKQSLMIYKVVRTHVTGLVV